MDYCEFLREIFNLGFPCCASCHDEHEYGLENGIDVPLCKFGGEEKDIPFLEVCCAFKTFMKNLTKEQKQKIRDNYDKYFYTEKR